MKIIVPLAGPDFERPDGSVKAQLQVDGQPLLRAALEQRPWWRSGQVSDEDLVFVLRDTSPSQVFRNTDLKTWYPSARVISLSAPTGGAAMSALAGVAAVADAEVPVCVDLVDILYQSTLDPASMFKKTGAGGIALVFESDDPKYSYLRTDDCGEVVEAAEKRVISRHASAGTYFFANPAIYLEVLAHSLRNREALTWKGLFYVCPLFNGVLASKRSVALERVAVRRGLVTN
jgi:hypothetical protein